MLIFQVCDKFELSSSAVTCLRYGGKYYRVSIRNVVLLLAGKEFWKSVKIWQRYCHESGGCLFRGTHCNLGQTGPFNFP